jgi:hypothetical protein
VISHAPRLASWPLRLVGADGRECRAGVAGLGFVVRCAAGGQAGRVTAGAEARVPPRPRDTPWVIKVQAPVETSHDAAGGAVSDLRSVACRLGLLALDGTMVCTCVGIGRMTPDTLLLHDRNFELVCAQRVWCMVSLLRCAADSSRSVHATIRCTSWARRRVGTRRCCGRHCGSGARWHTSVRSFLFVVFLLLSPLPLPPRPATLSRGGCHNRCAATTATQSPAAAAPPPPRVTVQLGTGMASR